MPPLVPAFQLTNSKPIKSETINSSKFHFIRVVILAHLGKPESEGSKEKSKIPPLHPSVHHMVQSVLHPNWRHPPSHSPPVRPVEELASPSLLYLVSLDQKFLNLTRHLLRIPERRYHETWFCHAACVSMTAAFCHSSLQPLEPFGALLGDASCALKTHTQRWCHNCSEDKDKDGHKPEGSRDLVTFYMAINHRGQKTSQDLTLVQLLHFVPAPLACAKGELVGLTLVLVSVGKILLRRVTLQQVRLGGRLIRNGRQRKEAALSCCSLGTLQVEPQMYVIVRHLLSELYPVLRPFLPLQPASGCGCGCHFEMSVLLSNVPNFVAIFDEALKGSPATASLNNVIGNFPPLVDFDDILNSPTSVQSPGLRPIRSAGIQWEAENRWGRDQSEVGFAGSPNDSKFPLLVLQNWSKVAEYHLQLTPVVTRALFTPTGAEPVGSGGYMETRRCLNMDWGGAITPSSLRRGRYSGTSHCSAFQEKRQSRERAATLARDITGPLSLGARPGSPRLMTTIEPSLCKAAKGDHAGYCDHHKHEPAAKHLNFDPVTMRMLQQPWESHEWQLWDPSYCAHYKRRLFSTYHHIPLFKFLRESGFPIDFAYQKIAKDDHRARETATVIKTNQLPSATQPADSLNSPLLLQLSPKCSHVYGKSRSKVLSYTHTWSSLWLRVVQQNTVSTTASRQQVQRGKETKAVIKASPANCSVSNGTHNSMNSALVPDKRLSPQRLLLNLSPQMCLVKRVGALSSRVVGSACAVPVSSPLSVLRDQEGAVLACRLSSVAPHLHCRPSLPLSLGRPALILPCWQAVPSLRGSSSCSFPCSSKANLLTSVSPSSSSSSSADSGSDRAMTHDHVDAATVLSGKNSCVTFSLPLSLQTDILTSGQRKEEEECCHQATRHQFSRDLCQYDIQ
ncbi:hypothetical protein L345_14568, partial [Ophiophagus hannah]